MTGRFTLAAFCTAVCLLVVVIAAAACCPAPRAGKPVVNADQTVIIVWDAAAKTQHFIRQASFQSEGDDFGFLIPSPTQPELDESGGEAFSYLRKLTEPEVKRVPRGVGMACGCTSAVKSDRGEAPALWVKVLEEKFVAGFHAAVLEANSATELVRWLKDHDYAYSREIEAWAKPYVEQGWKITALKVAKDKESKEKKTVAAGSFRMSFKTDRPLFPYREPESKAAADALGAKQRLLRIYFLADARYEGTLTRETPWTGKTAWAGKVTAEDRARVLKSLKLPAGTGPAEWWLTEFEDAWPYRVAPADVYFDRSTNQGTLKREPTIQYVARPYPTDPMFYALATLVVVPPISALWRRWRRVEGG